MGDLYFGVGGIYTFLLMVKRGCSDWIAGWTVLRVVPREACIRDGVRLSSSCG
jgi:hypothetical protein